jgi:hypothetical protein
MPDEEQSLCWGSYQLLRELMTAGGVGYAPIGAIRIGHMEQLIVRGMIERDEGRIRIRVKGEEFLRRAVYVPARSEFVCPSPRSNRPAV